MKIFRSHSRFLFLSFLVLGSLAFSPTMVKAEKLVPYETIESTPMINVWYGSHQSFGLPGIPQRQINILGNVTNATTLAYSLNGGNLNSLSIGPDTRRLQNTGDFAIDIFDRDLLAGENSVLIIANYGQSDQTQQMVTVQYARTNFWPENYTVDWSSTDLQTKVQFVDGLWETNAEGIRTAQIGYDRLIAIGDLGWRDYEITVPITMYSMDPAGYDEPSYGPAVGILMRWSGHTHDPVSCEQPDCGYQPYGAIGWYRWPSDRVSPGRLQIDMNSAHNKTDTSGRQLAFNTTYIFKMSVQTLVSGRSLYKLKVWLEGSQEPADWDLETQDAINEDPTGGSLLLLAHHVDAAFGNVSVVPLSPVVETDLVSDDFNRCVLENGEWNWANPLADASVSIDQAYTQDASLSISVPGGVEHALDRTTNTVPKVKQAINDGDLHLEVKFDSEFMPTNEAYYPFQGVVLKNDDNSRWVQVELRYRLSGVYLHVTSHEKTGATSWLTIDWLGEKITDNSQAEVSLDLLRYGSRYVLGYQVLQGDWLERLTFPFHLQISEAYIYAGNEGGLNAPTFTALVDYFIVDNDPIQIEDEARNALTTQTNGGGMVLRDPEKESYNCGEVVNVTAQPQENWNFSNWSGALESTALNEVITMTQPLTIQANFLQTAFNVGIEVVGSGSVIKTPDQSAYAAGETLVLTAQADPGWSFLRWEGDAFGNENEIVISIADQDLQIRAVFEALHYTLTVNTIGQGGVDITPLKTNYLYGEMVTLQALPASGWFFDHWEGGEFDTESSLQIRIEKDYALTAIFDEFSERRLYIPLIIK